ncbi:amidohydrolase family protein [Pirellulaceae bacterium SH467]|jgi:hypothetical protein
MQLCSWLLARENARFLGWAILPIASWLSAGNLLGKEAVVIRNATVHTVTDPKPLENATVLIEDGKVKSVGKDTAIPIDAQVIDGTNKHVTPGFLSVFYPLTLQVEGTSEESRTVVVGGRTFTLGGRAPTARGPLQNVSELIRKDAIDWRPLLRSGITAAHVVAPGYSYTAMVTPSNYSEENPSELKVFKSDGFLAVTITNNERSLDLLRSNLKPPSSTRGARGSSAAPPSNSSNAGASGPSTPPEATEEQKRWAEVREGAKPIVINCNNAATILHVESILKEFPKVKVQWIANGSDVYVARESIRKDQSFLLLPPRIDLIPNSRVRVNVPALAAEKKIPFAISLGQRSSDLAESQASPTFALGVLIKTGLSEFDALASVTSSPAKLLGLEKTHGMIAPGSQADLILFDGPPFDVATEIDTLLLEGKVVYEN